VESTPVRFTSALDLCSPSVTRKRAPELTPSRRNEILVHHVQSWMVPGTVPSQADILRLFECIERLVKMMEYDYVKLLWPMLIYAETYVRRTAQISGSQLFPHLVVAASLSMKMWEDYGPDLELTAHVCGITKKEISSMERRFLDKLNFNLNLQMADLEEFQSVPSDMDTMFPQEFHSVPMLPSR